MEWFNTLTRKWDQLHEKLRPGLEKTGDACKKAYNNLSVICGYLYKLRAIILAAPVAAAAVVLAFINAGRLGDVVGITTLAIDTQAQDSLFGCLVLGVDYISREVAILAPLVLTVLCLLMTLCSKRTLYPWLISLFSLALPLILLLTNVYAA